MPRGEYTSDIFSKKQATKQPKNDCILQGRKTKREETKTNDDKGGVGASNNLPRFKTTKHPLLIMFTKSFLLVFLQCTLVYGRPDVRNIRSTHGTFEMLSSSTSLSSSVNCCCCCCCHSHLLSTVSAIVSYGCLHLLLASSLPIIYRI